MKSPMYAVGQTITSNRGVSYYIDKLYARHSPSGSEQYAADIRSSASGKTKYAVLFSELDAKYTAA